MCSVPISHFAISEVSGRHTSEGNASKMKSSVVFYNVLYQREKNRLSQELWRFTSKNRFASGKEMHGGGPGI